MYLANVTGARYGTSLPAGGEPASATTQPQSLRRRDDAAKGGKRGSYA